MRIKKSLSVQGVPHSVSDLLFVGCTVSDLSFIGFRAYGVGSIVDWV